MTDIKKLFKLNIAVIVMLIGAVTCQNAHALRVPMGRYDREEKIFREQDSLQYSYERHERQKLALGHLVNLGADLDLKKLKPEKSLELLRLRQYHAAVQKSYINTENRIALKIQRLAGLLKINIAIHVMPSPYLTGITKEFFNGSVYIVSPEILKRYNINRDIEKAKEFLEEFMEKFGYSGTFGYGFKTKDGKPAIPITLFMGHRRKDDLASGFFLKGVANLDYFNEARFEKILHGLIQWDFEEIVNKDKLDEINYIIAERYIDKLIEIAEQDIRGNEEFTRGLREAI